MSKEPSPLLKKLIQQFANQQNMYQFKHQPEDVLTGHTFFLHCLLGQLMETINDTGAINSVQINSFLKAYPIDDFNFQMGKHLGNFGYEGRKEGFQKGAQDAFELAVNNAHIILHNVS